MVLGMVWYGGVRFGPVRQGKDKRDSDIPTRVAFLYPFGHAWLHIKIFLHLSLPTDDVTHLPLLHNSCHETLPALPASSLLPPWTSLDSHHAQIVDARWPVAILLGDLTQ